MDRFEVTVPDEPEGRVEVTGPDVRATLALTGATLLRFDRGGHAVVDGYLDADELRGQDGVRSGLLAPFAGRIRHARFSFAGQEHDLRPDSADRTVFHGFAREQEFALVDAQVDDRGARVVLGARLEPRPGYPFALDVRVTYVVDRTGVELHLHVTNLADRPAPVTLGWHPYLRLAGAPRVDDLVVQLAAGATVALDEELLPMHDQPSRPVSGTPFDLSSPTRLGDRVLDTCYVAIESGSDGVVRTELSAPSTGERLSVWQRGGLVYLYTGDRLERAPRASLAVESISHVPDAFNDAGAAGAISLPAGESRAFVCGFRYERDGR